MRLDDVKQVNAERCAAAAGPGPAAAQRAQEIERLFRDHNESLVSFLALRLRSRQEAREVAQETYVRLLQLERPGVTSFLRAYLFRIAGNLAVDRLRRRMTETRCARPELFHELNVDMRGPERQTLEQERMHLVQAFLDEVPEVPRRAFLMFRLEEKSQRDIAGELGVSDRMVRYHINRVLLYCRLRFDGVDRRDAESQIGWTTG